jgi:hypothetical protein
MYMAQLTLGRLPLCEDCLGLAQKAELKWSAKAGIRKKQEATERAEKWEKAHLTVSGGGANGTDKSSR